MWLAGCCAGLESACQHSSCCCYLWRHTDLPSLCRVHTCCRSALLNSCGTSSGSSSKADTQPSQLPAGQVQLSWSVDADAAPCFNYVPGPDGNWTLDTTSGPWGETTQPGLTGLNLCCLDWEVESLLPGLRVWNCCCLG